MHDDETVLVYHSAGQINIKGELIPAYYAPQTLIAQIQSDGGDALSHNDNIGQAAQRRKFYFHADDIRTAALIRQMSRGGDLIRRADGTWWLVTSTAEDFSKVGWVCVVAVMQVEEEDFVPRLIEIDDDGGDESDDDIPDTDHTPDAEI